MKTLLTLSLFILFSVSCGTSPKRQNASPEPSWLEKKIAEAAKESYLSVDMYLYKEDTVYLFVPPCCDRFSELYDQDGKLICHPDGGITGKGDGKCADFVKKAEKIKTLYHVDNEER
jgi:hypothetical protein